jgi:hypothetical protein
VMRRPPILDRVARRAFLHGLDVSLSRDDAGATTAVRIYGPATMAEWTLKGGRLAGELVVRTRFGRPIRRSDYVTTRLRGRPSEPLRPRA